MLTYRQSSVLTQAIDLEYQRLSTILVEGQTIRITVNPEPRAFVIVIKDNLLVGDMWLILTIHGCSHYIDIEMEMVRQD